jgi:hypothetical protein
MKKSISSLDNFINENKQAESVIKAIVKKTISDVKITKDDGDIESVTLVFSDGTKINFTAFGQGFMRVE